jgi:hypothetical protein
LSGVNSIPRNPTISICVICSRNPASAARAGMMKQQNTASHQPGFFIWFSPLHATKLNDCDCNYLIYKALQQKYLCETENKKTTALSADYADLRGFYGYFLSAFFREIRGLKNHSVQCTVC